MKNIWAPWRIEYIQGEKSKECIFCQKSRENSDSQNYILFRGEQNFVMLNTYPYNPGHLMVAPYRHLATLDELTDEELFEHFDIVRRSTRALAKAYKPGGFNIGINLGSVAGAGVEGHVHTHVVPRWGGDTNFMAVVSDIKVIPQALDSTYTQLKEKMA
ncbi:MAG: HIT domain-containing protein [Dehalococcoidia bacterium]